MIKNLITMAVRMSGYVSPYLFIALRQIPEMITPQGTSEIRSQAISSHPMPLLYLNVLPRTSVLDSI